MNKYILIGMIIFILFSPFIIRAFSGAAVSVDVDSVKFRVIRDSVLSSGNIIYKDEAQLSPEIIARVKSVEVAEGDKVQSGQILIRLDDQDIKEAIALQQAQVDIDKENVERQEINLKIFETRFNRMKSLLEQGVITNANYDDAYFDLKVARSDFERSKLNYRRSTAALSQTEKRLRQTIIRSPMDGTVVAVSIKPGETAVPSATGIPGSSLITIAEEESIVVDLNVDENDIANLSLGGEADINCPTLPDAGLKGYIDEVAIGPRNASGTFAPNDSTGRAYSVKVKIQDKHTGKLRSGMSCRAKIYTSNPEPTLSVPVQSIFTDRNYDDDGISVSRNSKRKSQKYLYVVNNGQLEKRNISTGVADDTFQEITFGLTEGEQVVIGPSRTLSNLTTRTSVEANSIDEGQYAATN